MISEYFTSLYSQFLRKKLQDMRLQFFQEFNAFEETFSREWLSQSTGEHLDNISLMFPRVLSMIQKIEKLEKKIGKESTFNGDDYMLSLYRDIFSTLTQIQRDLSEKYNSLLEAERALDGIKKTNASGKELINLERVVNYTLEENVKRALDTTNKNIAILREECQKFGADFFIFS